MHSQSNGNDTPGPSDNNDPKRRRQAKDDDFKDDYKSNYKGALQKLLNAKDFSVKHLAKKITSHYLGSNLASSTEI